MIWLLFGQILTAGLIAAALVALFRLSRVLQQGLGQINRHTHEPFVTVSLEASAAGRDHVNLVVENCGFAPAFDVRVVTAPEIPAEEGWTDRPADWHDTSLLRPGQAMIAYACRADRLTDEEIRVEVSWKNLPLADDCATLKYRLDMRRYPYQAALTPPALRDELTSELRLLRRDWRSIARGEQAMRVELGGDTLATLRHDAPRSDLEDNRGDQGRGEDQKEEQRRGRLGDAGPIPLSQIAPSRLSANPIAAPETRELPHGRQRQRSRDRSASEPRP